MKKNDIVVQGETKYFMLLLNFLHLHKMTKILKKISTSQ